MAGRTEMQSEAAESVRARMGALRGICNKEVTNQMQRIDSVAASFCKSLDSIKATAEETVQNQLMLGKMKGRLRGAEDEFVKVLAVKTRNEAKQMATTDSISATRARIEELEQTVELQRAKRDEYAAIMSQQAPGVKFTFNNINPKNPHEEYFFTIRHETDTYTLLACDPPLNDTKDLILELNRTNGLFKFVRTMREKFKEAASLGALPQSTNLYQEFSTSLSAPVLSVSTDRSASPMTIDEHSKGEVKNYPKNVNDGRGESSISLSGPVLSVSADTSESPATIDEFPKVEVEAHSNKVDHGRRAKQAILSSPRRSPRLKAKK